MNASTTDTAAVLGSPALQQFIDRRQIAAEIIPLGAHTATVADAALALGVDTDQIIKSLVFRCDDTALLVITNGLARVDRKKLAGQLGVGRKKVKFATAEDALDITGFIVGSMPPFGHRTQLRTLVDPSVTAMETVYGGGGDIDAMLRLTPGELLRVTGADVMPLAED
ncbi:MAG: YbaK/EbsC family protein [Pseudomonadota bacterium]